MHMAHTRTVVFPLVLVCITETLRSLKELNIIYADSEADVEIARFAQAHHAFVLSNDSDFFIFDTPGFIPFYSLSFNSQNGHLSLHGLMYKSKNVAQVLGIPSSYLPLLASLIGCDSSSGFRSNEGVKLHVHSCLNLLRTRTARNLTHMECLKDILESEQTVAQLTLDEASKAMDTYSLSSLQHLNLVGEGENVNDVFEKSYKEGRYHPHLMELKKYQIFWCSPFLQDIQRGILKL